MSQPSRVAEAQDAVVCFLSRGASYGTDLGEVQRIETHCSIVYLAGDRAYKLKRAIRYASLDYTTRVSRRAACEAELILNRRTAPEIYLAVRAITCGADGALVFDGQGPVLDHVVVMRRFAQSDLFDHMAENGRLTPALMRTLGEAVARFHLAAQTMPALGGSDALRRVLAENAYELGKVAATLDGAAVGTLASSAAAALDRLAALLDRRRAEGKVRRGHGDLRLANICLWSGQPTLFDCIEFSEDIGCLDVLYDLAFLLVDLQMRGLGHLGNVVFNAYLDTAPEQEGLCTLPLFLALRGDTKLCTGRRGAPPGQPSTGGTAAGAGAATCRGRHRLPRSAAASAAAAGGNDDHARAELAALLAAAAAPVPGARLLRLGIPAQATWREASAVLAAGCSVLIQGTFTGETARPPGPLAAQLAVQRIGLWLGRPPTGPDGVA